MRRVLLVQPSMQPPGGGNGVAAWMLQALVAEQRVTVLTWRPVEIDPINRFFGTSLRPGDFDTIVVPRTWRWGPDHLPVPASLLKSALLMRYTRRVVDAFDVIVGVHNETDYGRRGIQYVHYPTYLRPRPDVDLRWYHRAPRVLEQYYRFADRIAGLSFERLKANLTLANSNWTASQVRRFLGVHALTVYPPVVEPAPEVPWESRHSGFLAVGRISPEKEYERLMQILARVRRHAPELTLTIVGTWDRHSRPYYGRLRALAESLGSWVRFRHNLPRDEVRALMASHRYGIHGMREEHFGMAPAELARAGALVWVPRGGGQMEIVGDEPALLYDTDEEAVEKISSVMANEARARELREALRARSAMFGADRFVRQVQDLVRNFRE